MEVVTYVLTDDACDDGYDDGGYDDDDAHDDDGKKTNRLVFCAGACDDACACGDGGYDDDGHDDDDDGYDDGHQACTEEEGEFYSWKPRILQRKWFQERRGRRIPNKQVPVGTCRLKHDEGELIRGATRKERKSRGRRRKKQSKENNWPKPRPEG